MPKARPTSPLHCRLNLWHTWQLRVTEDGGRYLACAQCDKDRHDPPIGRVIGG